MYCTGHDLATGELKSGFRLGDHIGVLSHVHGLDTKNRGAFKWSLKGRALLFSGMGDNRPVYGDVSS